MFFSLLKPFLEHVELYIKKDTDKEDRRTVFSKYFEKDEYLADFDHSPEASAFAKKLIGSTQF